VNQSLVLRCDGSTRVGLGHLIRCLALAQAAAARGAQPRFLVRADEGALAVVTGAGFPVEVLAPDAPDAPAVLAAATPGSWVVLDGYELPADLGTELRRQCRHVLRVIDGHAAGEADLFVNANLHAPPPPSPRHLFGPRFALLRPEFAAARAAERMQRPGPLGLLVMFGGSDVAGLTARVLAWLGQHAERLPALVITAVLGPAASAAAATAARLAAVACRVPSRVLVAPPAMAEVMAEADLAITAAGGSVLELCALGVPALAVTVADNQRGIAAALAAAGAGSAEGAPDPEGEP